MSTRNKSIVFLICAVFIAGLFFSRYLMTDIKENADIEGEEKPQIEERQGIPEYSEQNPSEGLVEKKPVAVEVVSEVKRGIGNVPFISQAPTGDWSDPVFQNGCEEAVVLMAMAWVKGVDVIDVQKATEEIRQVSKYEEKLFGHSIDTEVADVTRFINGYYEYDNTKIVYDFQARDIVAQLEVGNLILVPTYGRALDNPNYTPPGPITHMLVITGYDAESREFVTNDPGTRRGAGYRYPEEVLMQAIWNYPTGKEHPAAPEESVLKKAMIVISKV